MIRLILAWLFLNLSFTSFAYDATNETYFPLLTPPEHLYVAVIWDNLDDTVTSMSTVPDMYRRDVVMLGSLAGIMLKLGSENGVFIEANADHRFILNDLVNRRSISYEYVSAPNDPWYIVDQLKSEFGSDYVLYDQDGGVDSLNVARMAAHEYDAIMVDVLQESKAIAHGLTKAFDCRGKDDSWIYSNWNGSGLDWGRTDIAVEQNNLDSGAFEYQCMNDYAAATGAVAFYDTTNTTLRGNFLSNMDEDSPVLGWAGSDELSQLQFDSERDTFCPASNFSYNLALLSAFRDSSLLPYEQAHSNPLPTASNVHYVTFVATDGDNIQWFHNGFIESDTVVSASDNRSWWANPDRGKMKMGWGMSSTMRDLSPTIVEHLYQDTIQEYFCSMGGVGAVYPSFYSSGGRLTQAARINKYFSQMDHNILISIDKYAFANPATVWNAYLAQPNIDAVFYWDAPGDYAYYDGDQAWVNYKPVITARTNLWYNLTSESQAATEINALPRNPYSEDGYSMVDVHVWSKSPSKVLDCINLLDSHVQVVTPEEFVKLVKQNLHPRLSRWDLELGNSRLGAWGTPSHANFNITTNNGDQKVDNTNGVKFVVGPAYGECNQSFTAIDARPADTFEFDLYGDGSGGILRLKLWSSTYSSYLYKDVTLNFSGWRHFSYRLDGVDGLAVSGTGTRPQILSTLNIFQVGAPWPGSASATFYLDNVRLVSREQRLERGNWQYGNWGATSRGDFIITTNSTTQQVDSTPSTKFQCSSTYGYVGMNFGALDVTDNYDTVEWDLHGANSGTTIRLKFWSSRYQTAVYKDITLNFSGWQHYKYKLDGSDGLSVYSGETYYRVERGFDIMEVSGPYNGTSGGTWYLDNVRFTSTHQDIDRGDWNFGTLSKDASITYVRDSVEQTTQGTPSIKIGSTSTYGELQWRFGEMDFSNTGNFNKVEFDLYGANSGATVRLKLWSTKHSSYMYRDVTLNYTGWRHYSYKLDGSDGLSKVGSGSYSQIAATLDAFIVGSPMNSTATTLYLDNVKIVK